MHHSDLKLFTGFASAAFIACVLIVSSAIDKDPNADTRKIHQEMSDLY